MGNVLFKFPRTLALKMGFDPYTSDSKVFTLSVLQGPCPGSGYLHSLRAQSIAITDHFLDCINSETEDKK